MTKFLTAAAAVLLALPVFHSSGFAADLDKPSKPTDLQVYPRLDYEIDVEIETQNVFDADTPAAETDELFTTTEPYLILHVLPGLTVESGLVAEPVEDLDPGETRIFGDHGFFVEQLFIKYDAGPWAVFGGKFNPTFGKAWEVAPGNFGTEPAEEFYEQVEFNGLGGALVFGDEGFGPQGIGKHTLTGQVFTLDTSDLSNSIFTERGEIAIADGGLGNTGDLDSFSITIDGEGIPGLPFDLNYHVGFLHLEPGVTETTASDAFAVALYGGIDITQDIRAEPIIEYVRINDAEGIEQDWDILTIGNAFLYGPYNLSISYTQLFGDPDGPGIDDFDFTQVQVTAGREFELPHGVNFDINLGYKFVETEEGPVDVDQHFFGAILHFVVEGSTAPKLAGF